MKKLIAVSLVLSSAAAFAETTVSDVIVRQQWPWTNKVNVDFIVGGSSGALSQVTMGAYAGDDFLGYISPVKCSGDTMITADGLKRITFDPTGIDFLSSKGVMNNFRIDVAIRDTPVEEILYKIYDLTKSAGEPGQVTCVTEFDLTNGVYGAWEKAKWGMVDTVVWTGVNCDEYKTTKLVMRRIPAGSVTIGTPTTSGLYNAADCEPTSVTITKPYYIAVFETTEAQQSWLLGAETKSESILPATGKWYANNQGDRAIRSRQAQGTTGTWPETKEPYATGTLANRPIIARTRLLTGAAFDLPTEAQWEKAARAGSTGVYYSSNSQDADEQTLKTLAWCANIDNQKHAVGLKLPNDYGLYDVLGNATEYVLDWHVAGWAPTEGSSDPEGYPTGTSATAGNKMLKGFSYIDSANKESANNIHLGGRKGISWTTNNAQHGYRLCCPAE